MRIMGLLAALVLASCQPAQALNCVQCDSGEGWNAGSNAAYDLVGHYASERVSPHDSASCSTTRDGSDAFVRRYEAGFEHTWDGSLDGEMIAVGCLGGQ